MTEKISQLREIIETAQHTELESKILSICSHCVLKDSRYSLDMTTLNELRNYCTDQLKLTKDPEDISKLQVIIDILEQNLQLEC